MREFCTQGSVGGAAGNCCLYPASGLPKLVFIEGVQPVMLSQIGAIGAGEVHFYRRGVLCSALSYGIGCSGSR